MSGNMDQRLDQFRERVVGRGITEQTYTDYEKWIRRFESWLAVEGRSFSGIGDLEDFDTFLADESRDSYPWANGRGRHPPDSYAYKSRVNAACAVKRWVRREYSTRIDDPPEDICLGSEDVFDPTYLDPADAGVVIDDADSACDIGGCQAALLLSYDAILRASELVRVRREDVDLSAGTLYVRASKGNDNAVVGLDQQTVAALQSHMNKYPQRERLFRNSYDRAWQSTAWSTHVLRNHCDAGAHSVGRHSPIMHRLEGADPPFLDESFDAGGFGGVFRRARHNYPSTTVKYAQVVGVSVPQWADNA
jgi:integrase